MRNLTEMKVLVAPCTFKESLTASEAAHTLATCVRRAGHEATELPLADGGEGTLAALAAPLGLAMRTVVVDAMLPSLGTGGRVEAQLGLRLSGASTAPRAHSTLAVFEAASVVGLTLVEKSQRDPLRATTAGLGELMNAAVEAGARELWIGLGGTATIDGGAGLLSTYRARDDVELKALVDVDVTLAGARMFMAQKFAGPVDDAVLDMLSNELRHMYQPHIADTPGAGAAGGLGAAIASLGGKLVSGADVVLREARVEDEVARADVVFTGEGRIDEQTKHGKLVAAFASMCRRHQRKLIAFCGDARGAIDGAEVVVITPRDQPMDEALARARENLDHAGSAVISRL
jgi:glycerate kinase